MWAVIWGKNTEFKTILLHFSSWQQPSTHPSCMASSMVLKVEEILNSEEQTEHSQLTRALTSQRAAHLSASGKRFISLLWVRGWGQSNMKHMMQHKSLATQGNTTGLMRTGLPTGFGASQTGTEVSRRGVQPQAVDLYYSRAKSCFRAELITT